MRSPREVGERASRTMLAACSRVVSLAPSITEEWIASSMSCSMR